MTGASRGIGAATARELARRGYALVLAARSADAINALAAELTRSGAPAVAVPADLSRAEDVARLARVALAQFGRVDALVNNAGIGSGRHGFARTDADAHREMLAVNLTAPVMLTHAILPHMLERRSGAIVFVGSVAGQIAIPGSAVYAGTKHGLRGFAHALRREVRRKGIGVTLVSPGFVDTDMVSDLRGIPKIGAAPVARAVADAIERPQREVVTPWYYAPLIWLDRLAPWLSDALLARVRRP